MKKIFTLFFVAGALLATHSGQAQKLKNEAIKYNYTRLPAVPVKGITNYQVVFQAEFESKNAALNKEYEQQKLFAEEKYRKDLTAYSVQAKAADERYEKEMSEYNKKSLGAKIAERSLLDNRKPVRAVIAKPYLENVEKPVLQSSYDYGTLGDTYIHLEGFQNSSSNALKLVVLLYGFDYSQPKTVDEQLDMVSVGNGRSSTYKSIRYHTEFSYRYPMAVKVFSPDGKELLSLTPSELNSYKTYKSMATDRPAIINSEQLTKTLQEKVLQENLRFINNLLNNQYGYSSVEKTANLYYIKNGDQDYADMTLAFNEASSGFLMLQKDPIPAKAKLEKACSLWKAALKESDLTNKKARINKDITIGIYFDLLEACFALGDGQEGQNVLDRINSINLSNSDRKTKLDYDLLFAELKNRQSHN
ncbi:MAG: hypothetical protein EOP45_04295 [Sphingobacteriaceae bacterium]|nr:MAG: hypothetical protein EOP45_04295 [Sphingobacteriaceae bacterium]